MNFLILIKIRKAWSKENLLNAWIEDPVKCCKKCGISLTAIKSKSFNNQTKKPNAENLTFDTDKSQQNNSPESKKTKNNQIENSADLNDFHDIDEQNKNQFSKNSTESNKISLKMMRTHELNKLKNDESGDDENEPIKTCGICFIDYEAKQFNLKNSKKVMCDHVFCKFCWNT